MSCCKLLRHDFCSKPLVLSACHSESPTSGSPAASQLQSIFISPLFALYVGNQSALMLGIPCCPAGMWHVYGFVCFSSSCALSQQAPPTPPRQPAQHGAPEGQAGDAATADPPAVAADVPRSVQPPGPQGVAISSSPSRAGNDAHEPGMSGEQVCKVSRDLRL